MTENNPKDAEEVIDDVIGKFLPSRTMENWNQYSKGVDRKRVIKLIIVYLITAHFISRLSKLLDPARGQSFIKL